MEKYEDEQVNWLDGFVNFPTSFIHSLNRVNDAENFAALLDDPRFIDWREPKANDYWLFDRVFTSPGISP